jgi:hypothetical protein
VTVCEKVGLLSAFDWFSSVNIGDVQRFREGSSQMLPLTVTDDLFRGFKTSLGPILAAGLSSLSEVTRASGSPVLSLRDRPNCRRGRTAADTCCRSPSYLLPMPGPGLTRDGHPAALDGYGNRLLPPIHPLAREHGLPCQNRAQQQFQNRSRPQPPQTSSSAGSALGQQANQPSRCWKAWKIEIQPQRDCEAR